LEGGQIVLPVGTSVPPLLIACMESSNLGTAHFDGHIYDGALKVTNEMKNAA
jgi:hypothetical protein